MLLLRPSRSLGFSDDMMVYFNLDMLFFTQLSLTTNAPGRVSGLEDLTNWSVAKLAQALAMGLPLVRTPFVQEKSSRGIGCCDTSK